MEWTRVVSSRVTPPAPPGDVIEARICEFARSSAAELERYCAQLGIAAANEQKHLQPSCSRVAAQLAAEWIPLPLLAPKTFGDKLQWVGLGSVDVVFRWTEMPDTFVELKCGATPSALGPCSWDALKLAAGILAGNAGSGYLLAGVPTVLWEGKTLGWELFTTREWRTDALRESFFSWWAFWEKDGHVPARVPEALATFEIEAFPLTIAGNDWQLRLSRVEPRGSAWLQWQPTLAP
jgi:hypothetical protein